MKVLVVRFSSIGDIVLTSPVMRCLKRQLGAEIHFLTKDAFRAVAETNPNIDRTWSIRKELSEVLADLKRENFDWVIDLHHNLRSLLVRSVLRKPSRTFRKLNIEKWLLVRFGIDRLPRIHIVERYMETLRPMGVEYDGAGLDYFIPPEQEVIPAELDTRLQPGNYIAFVIGATHATKRLPEDRIITVCRNITAPVVLLGGPAEASTGARIATAAGAHVLNTCGQFNLHQSASIVRQAGKVATHDTGLMHVAAAFRKPIVSIWGSTVPEFGMFPFYPQGVDLNICIQAEGLTCRPCSKIGHKSCPKGHFKCMNTLETAHICAALTLEN